MPPLHLSGLNSWLGALLLAFKTICRRLTPLFAPGRVHDAPCTINSMQVLGLTHPDTIASYEWLVELPNAEGQEDVIRLLKRQLSK